MERTCKTIVAVGAHTGDAQLTMGMLLAKQALLGDHVVTIDLTAGERGAPKGKSIDAFRAENVDAARRFAEKLGGESIVFDVPDGELFAGRDIAMRLADVLRAQHADVVLTHWQKSMHRDHEAAHVIVKDAVFYASLASFAHALPPAPIRKVLYAENWEDAEDFSPFLFVDVTLGFPLWKEAVRELWLTEHSRDFDYLRYYEALSIVRGAHIRKRRAAAFAVDAHARRMVMDCL